MAQLLTTAALIAALLSCPYVCAGQAGCCAIPEAAGVSQEAECGTNCCRQSGQAGSDSPPPAPEEDASTSCCLCKGAVLDGPAADLRLDLPCFDDVLPALATPSPVPPNEPWLTVVTGDERTGGGSLRAVLCSWLC